ncbi:hypothetical protein BwSH20_41010 [Bradyrhizobium ottawaense]|nr:hypothetical protein SG09_40880 [Bradyrhizobium ottawaense]BBO14118.1 hypothetical protein TM102_55880 [Bradyrhizobium sp. TM102]GMO34385.1 hypothetical protein BwSH14_38420 [Bradyrhizobium ottawaense]GMO35076.1 hypothetical protein BwSF12_34820 [Bradyrhizobium ottawaense]GMO65310.1 hypothetical protein BwSG10_17480 [Bradyrhizobium ottawaense]
MMVSRVDMKILDSPASTILVTNSEGARYDINGSFCFVREVDAHLARARLNIFGRAGWLAAHERYGELEAVRIASRGLSR